MKNNIPCFILARKGSKELKKKNKIKFLGKFLFEHTVNYAAKSKYVSKVIISTDDKDIANISKKMGCFVIFPRPKKLSNDSANTETALLHAAKIFEKKFGFFDIFAYLQITEPLRPRKILDKCIETLIKNKKIDSSFAAYEMHKNFWIKSQKNYKLISSKNEVSKPRQKKIPVYREDTGIALASRYKILKKNKRIGKRVKIISYSSLHGIVDIHNLNDLKIAKYINNLKK
jgi:CMP-N,N'-diacetyllegionaminic acid synthase